MNFPFATRFRSTNPPLMSPLSPVMVRWLIALLLGVILLIPTMSPAAEWKLPSANQGAWGPGTNVGVTGGIDQYRPGGARARSKLIDVTQAPYYVNTANPETTGTIAAGASVITVASATGFRINDRVRLAAGWKELQTLKVTSAASGNGNIAVKLPTTALINIPILASDTPTGIATKIRAGTYPDVVYGGNWTTGGSGTTVTFTSVFNGQSYYTVSSTGPTGYAATHAVDIGGDYGAHSITAISGNEITIMPPRAPGSGATNAPFYSDTAGLIQLAWDEAGDEDVVYLPAGTYNLRSTILINQASSNQTLRGAGASTVLHSQHPRQIFTFQGGSGPGFNAVQTVTGTKTKGTTALRVADSSAYGVGDLIVLSIENEENNTRIQAGAAPTWSNSGFPNLRTPLGRVTAVNAGTITIAPPLMWDCTPYAMTIARGENNIKNFRIGFEDFAITFTEAAHSSFAFDVASGIECWWYNISAPDWKKNTSSGSIINLATSYRCEIRQCDFRCLTPASYSDDGAIQLLNSTSCLIEDNICVGFDSGIYDSGRSYGHVISYNYMPSENYPGHNGHNSLTLMEGNVGGGFHLDSYHGSGSHQTFYRNYLPNGIAIKRFMYYMVSAGNVLGTDGVSWGGHGLGYPNIGNAAYSGTANAFIGDFHEHWNATGTLTTRSSDNSGTVTLGGGLTLPDPSYDYYLSFRWSGGGKRYQMPCTTLTGGRVLNFNNGSGDPLPTEGTAVQVWFFAGGYQELDLGVEHTLTRAGNYHSTPTTGAIQNATADTLPNSLAYSSKPAWFGDLAWPAVNPDSPVFSNEVIPAGYRFKHGSNPPGIKIGPSPGPVQGVRRK